jgi:hypothetical protein
MIWSQQHDTSSKSIVRKVVWSRHTAAAQTRRLQRVVMDMPGVQTYPKNLLESVIRVARADSVVVRLTILQHWAHMATVASTHLVRYFLLVKKVFILNRILPGENPIVLLFFTVLSNKNFFLV